MRRTILAAGVAGLIKSHVAQALFARGQSVVGFGQREQLLQRGAPTYTPVNSL